MTKLPRHLEGKPFPNSQSTKGGVATTVHDISSTLLRSLKALGIDHP